MLLIFIRASAANIENQLYKNFSLNTENEHEFGKFDDAIFKYEKNGETVTRLVQVKHVIDETKTLKETELYKKKEFTIGKDLKIFIGKYLSYYKTTIYNDFLVFTTKGLQTDEVLKMFEKYNIFKLNREIQIFETYKIVWQNLKENTVFYKSLTDIAEEKIRSEKLIELFCERYSFGSEKIYFNLEEAFKIFLDPTNLLEDYFFFDMPDEFLKFKHLFDVNQEKKEGKLIFEELKKKQICIRV